MPQRIVRMRSKRDESLLYMATKLGLVDSVEALLDRRAPIKTTFGSRKETVFHAAKRSRNKAVLRVLLSNTRSKYAVGMLNSKGRVYDNAGGEVPTRTSSKNEKKKSGGYAKLVKRMDPIPRRWVVAMAKEDIDTLRDIPEKWAKFRSYNDESLLYIAVRLGKLKSVRELLRHRAPIVTTYGGKKETPIHAAARKKSRINILRMLQANRRHKSASKIVDHKGRTYTDVLRIITQGKSTPPPGNNRTQLPSMSDSTQLNYSNETTNNTASSWSKPQSQAPDRSRAPKTSQPPKNTASSMSESSSSS